MRQKHLSGAFRTYRRALREARPFWPALILVLLLGLLGAPVALALPLPMKIILDNVLGAQPLAGPLRAIYGLVMPGTGPDHSGLFLFAILLAVATTLFSLGHRLGEWLLRERVADRMVHRFRGRLLLHGLRIAPSRRGGPDTDDLVYRILSDAPSLQWTALYGIIPVIVSAASLGSMLWVTATLSPKLALVALATALPTLLLIHLNQRRLRRAWHGAKEAESAAHSLVREIFTGLRAVTAFAQEERETARFLAASHRALQARFKVVRTEGLFGTALSLSAAVGTSAVLFLGVWDVEAGAMSVGDLVLVATYVGQLYAPLQAIGSHFAGQQQAVASAERVFRLLDEAPRIAERPGLPVRGRPQGEVVFKRVGFAHDGRPAVLREVDLTIPAGTRVGIVGRSGAGKTTLVSLLMRLADPVSGRILLDGVDLRDWRLDELRRQFGVVTQDPILFSTTIAENIAYGRPEADAAEIVAAAERAGAHPFISALPEGYATRLDERGLLFSGGERQRIALARAFLKDAPILILDEPTSALDERTESSIIDAIEAIQPRRTTFLIAHRPATLRVCDMVLRIERGEVMQQPVLVPLERRRAG